MNTKQKASLQLKCQRAREMVADAFRQVDEMGVDTYLYPDHISEGARGRDNLIFVPRGVDPPEPPRQPIRIRVI